ncbi:serine/threonine-protein kinase [Amycolatopsis taiwanensis]|uniref:serine/threonine-protein kinase n=1 Tax=Amycolatopsis taiwanensis TaxID=342230 RepID=UPI0004BA54F3|nr:serine/threonine-protein kinase [Amycolatopsis taiwanensis]
MAAVGDKIAGRYLLRKRLGSGGMGVVWLASDTELERDVALKCPQVGDKAGAKRLQTEARNAARLRHPHIVGVHDIFSEGEVTWLVMEYVEARSLAEIVRESGALKPARAATIGWQVADALAAAHARGIVHCDVTPENILLAPGDVAKLTDFGVSRALWNDVTQTDSAIVRGKLPYLAPEVARGQKPGPESDVFSLGATLYAGIEGRPVFGDVGHPAALLSKAAEGVVAPPGRAGALTVPLTQLLLANPHRRPDAGEAATLFKKVSPPDPEILHREAQWRDTAVPSELHRRIRRRRIFTAAAAAVAVVAVAVGVVLALPRPNSTAQAPLVGDARTADPCALVSTASLARFGEIVLSTDSGNFNRCDLLVKPNGEVIADVKLVLDNGLPDADSRTRTTQAGNLTLLVEPLDDDTCDRSFALPDGHQVGITGRKDEPTGPDPCALADAATDYAAGVLNRGPIPRRAAPFPAQSLASADACSLLDATALSSVPGVDARHPVPGFGNWSCRWNSSIDGRVDVFYDRNPPLGASDGQPMTLAGRDAFMTPGFDDPKDCTIRTEYRDYYNNPDDHMVELLVVKVVGERPMDQRCETAKTLTTAAVTALEAKAPR